MDERPTIAITMGDPAGIGPEIVAKALDLPSVTRFCRPFVIGCPEAIEDGIRIARTGSSVRTIQTVNDVFGDHATIDVLEVGDLEHGEVALGQVSAKAGKAAVEVVEEAARMAIEKRVDAIVTCPINKQAVHLAGFKGDIGHQEILARMTGASLTATMLMTNGLRVAHVSTHKPLSEAVAYVRKEAVLAKLRLTHESLERWGLERPRIALAALNPHGGDGGLLGREEIDEIKPAVEAGRVQGIDAHGPFPGDSVFYRAIAGEFDAVLAMYHDQGHIAIKVHDFEDSVTVTMGIPFVRTSVDHGTAFDIAGKGIANPQSLVRSISTAVELATRSLSKRA